MGLKIQNKAIERPARSPKRMKCGQHDQPGRKTGATSGGGGVARAPFNMQGAVHATRRTDFRQIRVEAAI